MSILSLFYENLFEFAEMLVVSEAIMTLTNYFPRLTVKNVSINVAFIPLYLYYGYKKSLKVVENYNNKKIINGFIDHSKEIGQISRNSIIEASNIK